MSSVYFSITTLRLTFIVGVSSPPSTVNSAGTTANFLTISFRASDLFTTST